MAMFATEQQVQQTPVWLGRKRRSVEREFHNDQVIESPQLAIEPLIEDADTNDAVERQVNQTVDIGGNITLFVVNQVETQIED